MKNSFGIFALILSTCFLSYNCRGQTYQLTDLGALIGPNSYAQGINNQGQVVGYWDTPNGAHAFLYQAGTVTDLGLLGGNATNNYALSVNNAGQVVGFSQTSTGAQAFLYQNGTLTNLGNLNGLSSYAYGINGSGQIVGYVDTANGSRAILYSSGESISLGTLGGTNSFAFGINNGIQVAGSSLLSDNATTHAFLWHNGVINDLNQYQTVNSGWQLTDAHGINDSGNIVGWGVINGQNHAFLISSSGFATDLGVLGGGTNSYALGLNNSNQVVGASSSPAGNHAVFWQNGVANDLNNLVNASGWELREACGINDLGQIVGWGIINGQGHAFLLTPNNTSTGLTGFAANAKQAFAPPAFLPPGGSLTISITNPVNNAVIIASQTNLALSATAADGAGTITQVQFFQGTISLGIVTSAPFNLIWSNAPAGNYGLTATALDNSGNTATSSVVNITITPLFATNTMNLWLKGDAIAGLTNNAPVGTWTDSSGWGHNVTQGTLSQQPLCITNVINGLPVVRFNSTNNQYLNLPNCLTPLSQAEVFAVVMATNWSTAAYNYLTLWHMGSYGYGSAERYPYYDGSLYEDFGNAGSYVIGVPAQPLNQYHLYEVSAQATNWAAWINGVLLYQTTNNTVGFPSFPTLGTTFNGDIAEVLIFNRALTAGERVTVNEYLNGKYGLVTAVPPTPSNLVAIPISQTQIGLTWNETLTNGGATQISIERKTGSGGTYAEVARLVSALSYMDTNLTAGTTYYYRVRAINLNIWSPYSNETNATTLSTGADVPLGSLVIWLKADSGLAQGSTNTPVDLWADQGGNGNNAQQITGSQQPTWVPGVINGLPVVRFNSTNNQYLNLPNCLTPLSQAEVFAVVMATNWSTAAYNYLTLWHMGSYGYGSAERYPYYDGSLYEDFGNAGSYVIGVPAQPLNQYHLYEVSAQATNWAAWINGVLLYQTTNNTVGFPSFPTLGTTFNGDIAEVLIFNRALTAGERVTVNEYLNGKYGLVTAVPPTPSNLVAIPISQTQIGLTWNETLTNGGATQISIERKTGSGGTYAEVARLVSALSYMDTNLTAGTTYYYRVRAINLNIWSPYSNETNATTLSTGADVPLGSLVIWLKADSGLAQGSTNTPVDLWADQGGNGNNAQQITGSQQPTWVPGVINGLPVVRFNSTNNQYLNLPNCLTPLSQAEVFAVVMATNWSTAAYNYLTLWHMGSYGYGSAERYPYYDGSLYEDFGNAGSYVIGVPAQPLNQYHLYEVSAQATNWAAWINGVLLYQTTNNTVGFPSFPTLGTTFNGDIAEVLIFNRALTAGERVTVNEYLNGKYGLVTAVPPTPSNLVAIPISQTQIGLTWNETLNQGATQISVERSTASNGVFTVVAQVAALSFVDTNLLAGTKYYYRVRAINFQWSPYSGVAYATTLTNGVSLPFGSLALWLKADSGLAQIGTNTPVELWTDQSGNGNNAQQPVGGYQPLWVSGALNGLPVVQFNGTSSYFSLPPFMNAATGGEAFVVLKVSATNSLQSLWEMGGYGVGGQGDTELETYPDTDGSIKDGFGSMTRQYIGVPAQPLTQYHLFEVSSQTNNWMAWINGILQYQTSINTVGFFNSPTLGTARNNTGDNVISSYFAGNVAEVLVFSRALTGDEKVAVGTYLFSKYNLLQYDINTSGPAPPTNMISVGLAPGQLNLQWVRTSTNELAFDIERKLGAGGTYQEIGNVPTGVTNFLDATAIPTNIYFYRTRALNYFGASGYAPAISPPTISVTNWPATALENATNRVLAQAADANGTVSNVQLLADNYFVGNASSAPYTFNWMPPFTTTYVLSALATDSFGNSQYSTPVSVAVYLDSNGDGIPDYLQVSQGNNPLNPWVPPAANTNDHTAPIITLLIPTNAIVVH